MTIASIPSSTAAAYLRQYQAIAPGGGHRADNDNDDKAGAGTNLGTGLGAGSAVTPPQPLGGLRATQVDIIA